jgi:hypothetical protein
MFACQRIQQVSRPHHVALQSINGLTSPPLANPNTQRVSTQHRFEALNGNQLFQLMGVAIICGLLWWQRGRDTTVAGASDVLGLIFFEMLFVSFR